MSWAVIVVPMFAPKMTAMAWRMVMRRALTKPMAMTVVALGALQHGGGHRTGQHAEHGIGGEQGQDRLHLGAGGLLQALGHHVHAEQEHSQSAQEAEHGFHRSVHAGLPFASVGCSVSARESKGYRVDGKAFVKGR